MNGHILVTGATRGIGRAVVEDLLEVGASIVGVSRTTGAAFDTLASALNERGALIAGDLTTNAGIETVVRTIRKTCGSVSGAVFNAGTLIPGLFQQTLGDNRQDPLDHQLTTNLRAPLALCRALLREGAVAEPASLIFVSSNLVHRAMPGRAAYTASKAGLEGVTRALAVELGGRRIRVNAVAPGLVRTDMTAHLDEEAIARHEAEVPLGRVALASDIAPVVRFLLGDASRHVTGQVLIVDGGWSC